MTHAEYARLGGMEGSEVIMWLVARGALSASVRKIHQTYYLPSMTGIATAIYENKPSPVVGHELARHLDHMGTQLAGAERLTGTYPFDLDRSVRTYQLNRFLHDLIDPDHRAAFLADEDATMRAGGLTDAERDMVLRRDWRALIQYGAIFFVLEKLAAVIGTSNLHVYAAMRGQSLEDFQQTRNAPTALYSVAGGQVDAKAWAEEAKQS